MARQQRKARDDGAPALFAVDEATPARARRAGHYQLQLRETIDAVPALKLSRWAAVVSAARAAAVGLDQAERDADLYATAQLLPRYQELLTALSLVPEPQDGGDGDDGLAGFGVPS